MTEKQPGLTGSDPVTAEKLRPKRRLIGSDGELLVAVDVEKPKHHPADPSLNRRLVMLVMLLVLVFSIAAIAVVVVQGIRKAAVPSTPGFATIPAKFANGPYEVTPMIHKDGNYPARLPCDSRQIRVKVEGNTPVKIHLWAVAEHGSINTQVNISATKRTTVFDIPALQGDIFNMEMNDAQDNPLAGLKDIQFGTKDFPFCELSLTFEPMKL